MFSHCISNYQIISVSGSGRAERRPVAVILFKNETGDNNLDYLAEAIPNLLITNLDLLSYNFPLFIDCLARCYEKKGEIDKAIAEYERLITFNPQSKDQRLIYPKYHYRLAKLYEQKGLNYTALEQYNQFLLIDKNADPKIPELIDAKARITNLTTK